MKDFFSNWINVPWIIRFLVYVAIAFLFIGALSGCATSVSFKMGDCSTKMTGLFFAHGLSPAVARDCIPEIP